MTRVYSAQEAHNRDVAIDYYTKLICQWDYAAASDHLGDRFVQHNPTMPDGRAGLEQWIANVPDFVRDNLKTEIKRVLVDGDMVAIHTLNSMPAMPQVPARVIADFFRLEHGKVVEHWDVLMDVPAESLHENPIA